jgi:hypothetical protein
MCMVLIISRQTEIRAVDLHVPEICDLDGSPTERLKKKSITGH